MIVLKYEKPEQDSLQDYLDGLLGDRLAKQILDYLSDQAIEVVHGWTEERVADRLFSEANEDYRTYGNGIMAYLPEGFLEYSLGFVGNLDEAYEESLDFVFSEVTWANYRAEVIAYAQEVAEKKGEAAPDFTISGMVFVVPSVFETPIAKWLKYIVRKAIAQHTGKPFVDREDEEKIDDGSHRTLDDVVKWIREQEAQGLDK